MYPLRSAHIRARLEAENALLRAGLERAARRSGIEIGDGEEMPALALRSAGAGESHPSLDVAVNGTGVVVTVNGSPPPEIWTAIYQLIGNLSAPSDGHSSSAPPAGPSSSHEDI